MDTNMMIVCAMLVGFFFGVLFGYFGGVAVGEATERQHAKNAHAAGFRAGQRAEFEAQAAQHVARQSRQLQGLDQ